MTTYFITRHEGAREWAARKGIRVDATLDHLEVASIQPGDTVIGVLPVHLAAQVCERGARYFHFAIDLPPEMRGRELTADELEHFDARIEEYHVLRAGPA